MFKKFLPKNDRFFILLNEMAKQILDASLLLHEMLNNFDLLPEYSSKIHIIENRCDDYTHEIINELNETFITPIDREDIYELASSLDDIIDCMDTIGTRMSIYKIKTPLAFGPQLTDILLSQVKLISEVLLHLQDEHHAFKKLVQIRNLETEGDSVFRESLRQLFEHEQDLLELIKKKEILETLERAVDRCQVATLVMERIMIKNM